MSRDYRTMTLDEARARTPRVSAIEAMRNQLQLALFGAVTEGDVAGMAAKLKEMALAGDLRAMKLFFSLIDTRAAPPQIVKIEQAVVQLEQSLEQVRSVLPACRPAGTLEGLAPPVVAAPTDAPAGSEDKLRVIEHRVARGLEATHPGDAPPLPPTNGHGPRTVRPPHEYPTHGT